jgi:hypothetical protein
MMRRAKVQYKHYHGRIIPCMMRQIRHGVLGVVAAVAGGGVVVVV